MTTGASAPGHATDLTVDLAAIVANWRELGARHRHHAGGPVGAVLKADAYGTGARQVAPALFAAGCRHFFVAHLEEALAIRALVPGALLAVLNGLWPGLEPDYIAHDIRPVLGSIGEIELWSGAGRREGRRLPALLHVDTGMNRLGLPVDALPPASELDGIALEYVMTHLVSAEIPEARINEHQLARFAAACVAFGPVLRSLANSSGIFLGPGYASDLARPGAALYGVNPTPGEANPMRSVVRLRARILQVREIAAGATVGYNGIWTAERLSRIATVSVGYADGFLRSLGNIGEARFDGKGVPLVGRVSMDLTTFDVTDVPHAAPGDWLELIGPDMPVDAVAARAGTNGYEILTSLGRRYARTYLPTQTSAA